MTTHTPDITRGFRTARAITKKHAKTFYFASRFLPAAKRNASYAVYAICRISDDAVDVSHGQAQRRQLLALKEKVDAAYRDDPLNDDLLAALRETVRAYSIPSAYFDDLRAGMQMDIEKSRYATFPELRTYCYRVAGVVGLIMLRIFGCSDKKAEQFAEDLGIALQLTNIIRDIREDFIRGRIYLPQDEMEQHNVTERHIETGEVDSAWQDFLKFQIRRARHYYAAAAGGTRLIRDRRSRLVVLAISKMYEGILDEIERATYNVFFQRAHVNSVKKFFIALKIIISGEYT